MTSIICITCPKGCRLSVDEENGYKVTGNGCPRGEIYGKNELQHPVRVITSARRAYPRHGRQYRRDKGVVKRHFSGL